MARQDLVTAVFICDECGQELEAESVAGLMPPMPVGWMQIQGTGNPAQDMVCSWDCIDTYTTKKAKEKKAEAQARAERRKALAANAKTKGGVV